MPVYWNEIKMSLFNQVQYIHIQINKNDPLDGAAVFFFFFKYVHIIFEQLLQPCGFIKFSNVE